MWEDHGENLGENRGELRVKNFAVLATQNRGQISPNFREVFAAFSQRISKQVSQRLLPGVPPTSRQHGRQSVLYDNFLRIPSQNGCCGPSVRLLLCLHSQETQASRKVAGWRSSIAALDFFF